MFLAVERAMFLLLAVFDTCLLIGVRDYGPLIYTGPKV